VGWLLRIFAREDERIRNPRWQQTQSRLEFLGQTPNISNEHKPFQTTPEFAKTRLDALSD